ncbi:hypothetical protein T09_14481 [Trichinella sp. T9]|nr:hypothetical protein T09_5888 [Trichinella sp. T9]KRX65076.1 hypothetical protein T09_14481 [Trichinella sp. T9]
MDVKAFPSRPSVPLLITNSQRRNSILSYGSDVFPCHARRMVFNVLVRSCEDESRILNDVHRITAKVTITVKGEGKYNCVR